MIDAVDNFRLNNGAVIIALGPENNDGRRIVLARIGHEDNYEYVTWTTTETVSNSHESQLGLTCIWGHYFDKNYKEAVEDFCSRIQVQGNFD